MAHIFEWVLDLIGKVFLSLWTLVTDFFAWILESLLAIVVGALTALGSIPGASLFSGAMEMLPPEAWTFMLRFNLPLCSGIIMGAIVIRLLLQLIPFVRLGS